MFGFVSRSTFFTGLTLPFLLAAGSLSTFAQSNLSPCPSDASQEYNNCYGIDKSENGDRYIGEFQQNKRSGIGTYEFSNGGRYFGEFKNDEFSGRGVYTFKSGDVYVGEFRESRPNGSGTYTFKSGDSYSGAVKDWQFHGKGVVIYVNGDSYLGSYEKDKRKGAGTYIWKDGARYEGQWENGLPASDGVLTDSSGKVVIGAEFKTTATYDSDGYITSPDVLTYSGGTLQREAKKRSLIDEVEVGSRSVQVYDDFTWQYSRGGCDLIVKEKLFFCGDTSKWMASSKRQNEESVAEYSVDDRNYALYIHEEAGKVDGLDSSSMRQAIIGYLADGAQKSGEEPRILEENERILWGTEKAKTIVVATRYNGIKLVFANTYISRDKETLQIVTFSLGEQYTDAARSLHEEFVNSTAYD